MSSNQTIGQMDPAYFQGRKCILEWINDVCQLKLEKVEQTCTGAVACQLLDSLYPGKIPMSKVDWSANKDYEYVANYKVLQTSFSKLKINKPIHVDRLIRGRYQDNLEFMQWFKGFYDLNCNVDSYADLEYDAVGQRNKGKGGARYALSRTSGKPARSGAPARASAKTTASTTSVRSSSRASRPASRNSQSSPTLSAEDSARMRKLELEKQELATHNEQLETTLNELENERNFYYRKLKAIEDALVAIPDDERDNFLNNLLTILYNEEGEEENDQAEQSAKEKAPELDGPAIDGLAIE